MGWGRTVRYRVGGGEELRQAKKYEFLGETPPNLHHMRGLMGQSCGGANQEGRPPNGSKVLQRSGSSVINNGWLSR